MTTLLPRLYFSYGQFLVYDQDVAAPGCLWTEAHTAQGFARRESTVCFGTLFEFGYADVAYALDPFTPDESYERAIAVPFVVASGKVVVDGPEENDVKRIIELPKGHYRLVATQRTKGDEEEAIALFFEKLDTKPEESTIIVADGQLESSGTLLESADVA